MDLRAVLADRCAPFGEPPAAVDEGRILPEQISEDVHVVRVSRGVEAGDRIFSAVGGPCPACADSAEHRGGNR